MKKSLRKKPLPPDAELYAEAHRLFLYDPRTGKLLWRDQAAHGNRGTEAGTQLKSGYRRVRVLGHLIMTHRVIWLMVHGAMPRDDIDHKNLDPANNKLKNLREATRLQNMANHPSAVKPSTGASRDKWGKYRARIGVDGEKIYLGRFDTEAEARAAYVRASRELRGEFSPV